MNRQDTVKMEINIAGERLFITVPFSQQDAVRDTERNVEALFTSWRRQFPNKSAKELLAMLVYQYASFYFELKQRVDTAKTTAADVADRLDALLGNDI